ncbi:hypothetical protein [Bradyrhizobium sp. CCBAU 21362]|uniref:hypothetical protein n=1 Tax=Bradyrhizobium sp. CCBAU 21362 TaxID=1325082 RepID=UPI00230695BA|nr:hypothetical protein [Bradyrhizobium sp. CCBAU 21362]
MARLFSFDFTQSGENLILNACVPFSVGVDVFRMISEAASREKLPVKTKRVQAPQNASLTVRSLDVTTPKSGKVKGKRARSDSLAKHLSDEEPD